MYVCHIQIVLSDVTGTGKDGRVLKEDIIRYLESRQSRYLDIKKFDYLV